MVTGTSVLGVTFGDGVMLAADTLGKFGEKLRAYFLQVTTLYHKYTQVPTDPSLAIEVCPGCTRRPTAVYWEQLVTLLTSSSWGDCLKT